MGKRLSACLPSSSLRAFSAPLLRPRMTWGAAITAARVAGPWRRAVWPGSIRLISPKFSATQRPPRHMASSERGMTLGTCGPVAGADGTRCLPLGYRGPAMTLAKMRAQGVHSLAVTCDLCHHAAVLSADAWADDAPVPSFGPRMVCTCCGIIGAGVRPNWLERRSTSSPAARTARQRSAGCWVSWTARTFATRGDRRAARCLTSPRRGAGPACPALREHNRNLITHGAGVTPSYPGHHARGSGANESAHSRIYPNSAPRFGGAFFFAVDVL
jgi:hypothetical protein